MISAFAVLALLTTPQDSIAIPHSVGVALHEITLREGARGLRVDSTLKVVTDISSFRKTDRAIARSPAWTALLRATMPRGVDGRADEVTRCRPETDAEFAARLARKPGFVNPGNPESPTRIQRMCPPPPVGTLVLSLFSSSQTSNGYELTVRSAWSIPSASGLWGLRYAGAMYKVGIVKAGTGWRVSGIEKMMEPVQE